MMKKKKRGLYKIDFGLESLDREKKRKKVIKPKSSVRKKHVGKAKAKKISLKKAIKKPKENKIKKIKKVKVSMPHVKLFHRKPKKKAPEKIQEVIKRAIEKEPAILEKEPQKIEIKKQETPDIKLIKQKEKKSIEPTSKKKNHISNFLIPLILGVATVVTSFFLKKYFVILSIAGFSLIIFAIIILIIILSKKPTVKKEKPILKMAAPKKEKQEEIKKPIIEKKKPFLIRSPQFIIIPLVFIFVLYLLLRFIKFDTTDLFSSKNILIGILLFVVISLFIINMISLIKSKRRVILATHYGEIKKGKHGIIKVRALGKYETEFDLLLELINKYHSLSVIEISEIFNIKKPLAEHWAKVLEDHQLVFIHYPVFGSPIVKSIEEQKRIETKKIEKKAKTEEQKKEEKKKIKKQKKKVKKHKRHIKKKHKKTKKHKKGKKHRR